MRAVDPQAQLVAVEYLRQSIAGCHVGTFVPRERPPMFLVVQRNGGVMRNPITDGATITVQAYAQDQYQAERLAGWARTALQESSQVSRQVNGHLVRGWREYGGPQRYTDPDNPTLARFQFSGELLVSCLT